MASLIERGYGGTSTPEVCRRAGVARGAQLHHYPPRSRDALPAISAPPARRWSGAGCRSRARTWRLLAVCSEQPAQIGPIHHGARETSTTSRALEGGGAAEAAGSRSRRLAAYGLRNEITPTQPWPLSFTTSGCPGLICT